MEKRTKVFLAVLLYVLFLTLVVLLRTVDVQPIGPQETSIGLASLNASAALMTGVGGEGGTGVRYEWYKLTEYLGYFAILVALCIALLGFVQLIRRRSLRRMDRELIAIALLYIVTAVIYVFFEKVIINYRPFVLPGEPGPEASFPSSHTLLLIVILGSAAIAAKKYVKAPALRLGVRLLCLCLILAMVFGRLYCGCHWFTDILGSVLLGGAMLAMFSATLDREEPEGP